MSIGSIARGVLGHRLFPVVGRYYRALFVDLEKVVDSFPRPPAGAEVLDIGGGDGELIKLYIRRYPDARVTMIDLKPRIGDALSSIEREQVQILEGTSIRDLVSRGYQPPNVVLISDVLHHISPSQRPGFLTDIRDLLRGHAATLIVKDVEPGPLRATLAYLADRYISGDRNVQPAGQADVARLVQETFPGSDCRPTNLIDRDAPNYCLVFAIAPTSSSTDMGAASSAPRQPR